jgi:hypothetical protein
MIKQGLSLKPGQVIPPDLLSKLQQANESFTKTKNRAQYLEELKSIFQIQGDFNVTTESKFWLGGFVEGEGSINVSCKKNKNDAFGVLIEPEFSVTQHVNGFSMLYTALVVFQAGRITYKSGSNATLVFTIDNRLTLEEKVIPFFENYVVPYGSTEKVRRLDQFKKLLELFKQSAHTNQDTLVNKVLPVWDSMRKQVGQSNQTFPSLQDAQQYAVDFAKNKNKTP